MDERRMTMHLGWKDKHSKVSLIFRQDAGETRKTRRMVRRNDGTLKKVFSRWMIQFTDENQVIKEIRKGKDVSATLLESDSEIEMDAAGEFLDYRFKVLRDENGEIVRNYNEYEVIKARDGTLLKERKLETTSSKNINEDQNPVRILTRKSRLEVLKKYAFKYSYQLGHVDGLSYDFLKSLALELQEHDEMALVAPVKKVKVDGKEKLVPERVRLRNGARPYWAWLEGRVNERGYALIMHLTSLELT